MGLAILLALGRTGSAAISVGGRVSVTQNSVNVRAGAGSTTINGTQNTGALGTVTGGPTSAQIGGAGTTYTWWNINFDSGTDGWVASINLAEVITTPALSITTNAFNPSTATVGTGYSAQQAVTATGGQTPYTWSASGLPGGMGINSSSGAIFGTPNSAGTYNVNVTVKDNSSPQKTASKSLTLTVNPAATNPPSATTNSPSNVTSTSAQFNGTINPNGTSTSAYFEYGSTTSYGSTSNSSNFGSGTSNVSVQTTLTGATPGATIHYRVVAVNSAGQTARGNDVSFTTTASTPALSITTTAFNPSTATVGTGYSAQQAVTATGGQTPYSWSASGLPGGMGINSSSGAIFGTPTAAGTFNVNVTVTDSSSPQKTASKTLTLTVSNGASVPSAPTINGPGTATDTGLTTASLTPTFTWTAVNSASSYSLFISKSPYGSANIIYSATGLNGTSSTLPAGYLQAGVKYRWNMTASNSTGESGVSNTLYFTGASPTLPAPSTQTLTATLVTASSAQMNATINPNGASTTAYFEYGLTTSYGSTTGAGAFGSGTGAVAIQATVSGLAANTTYHCRVVASSSGGVTNGNDVTFKTASTSSALAITTTAFNPATATVGVGYSAQQAVTATGGQTAYTWSASGLPAGMGINSSSGAIFGTPTAAGTFNVIVTVTDSSSPQKTASKTLTLNVGATSSAPIVTSISPNSMTPSTVTLMQITLTGSHFSTTGGHLHFTDPHGDPADSTAHPERVVSVSSTKWVYNMNNGGLTGQWSVQVVNADGQASTPIQFTVAPNVQLTLTAPNGGETWQAGSSQTITWQASGNTTGVAFYRIAYSKSGDNPASYSTPVTSMGSNARSASWVLPADAASAQGRIRIEAYDINGLQLGGDSSDANFTVTAGAIVPPDITITLPLAGDNWTAGSTRIFTWSVSPGTGGQIASFIPEYAWDGVNFTALPEVNAGARQASVPVPLSTTSTQARVRVRALSADRTVLATAPSQLFNIVAPAVTYPTARADASNANPDWGQTVSFLGSRSTDSAGGHNISAYAWDFGDGQSSSQADPAHTFQGSGSPRNFSVKLTVTDFAGKTNTAGIVVLVGSTRTSGTNNLQGHSADPVNLATGNYSYEHVDLRLPGRGLPFEFKRYYNSKGRIDASGPLGPRWTHSYQLRLAVGSDGKVTLFRGDGNTEAYELSAGGAYKPEAGVHNRLVKKTDGLYVLTTKELVRHDFDAQGRVAAITDRNGNALSFHYSGAGVLDTVTDTVGRVIAFSADANGRLTGLTDPLNRTIVFTYDGAGDLVASTDRRGKTTRFTYDSDHQITEGTDPLGHKFVRNEYDPMSRVVKSQKDALDGGTSFEYDFQTRITTLTDALGYKSYHRHDEKLRLIAVTDPLGETERYEYDADNNRVRVTDKLGGITTYAYDGNGNVTAKVDALGKRTTIAYDARNNPTRRTDVLGRATSFVYDAPGNLTRSVDPAGAVTLYSYDEHGQLIRSVDPLLRETKREYDAHGNLSKSIDALTNVALFTYDAAGRRLSQQDALNRLSRFAYDEEGNLLTTTDAAAHAVTNTYDDNGNRVTTQDARGNVTQFTYDAKDRLIKVQDALGNTTQHTYDALDRRISSVDPLLHTTTWSYDALGRVLQAKDAHNSATTFSYDANGNQTSATDALGHVRWVQYDALNRPIRAGDPLGNVTRTDYDALGRKVQVFDALGRATGFAYDVIGRLVRVIDAAGGTVRYTYDKAGNRLTMSDPKGYTTRYAYDKLNRRIEMREPMGGQTVTTYDAAGNRIGSTDPKGQHTTFTYDVLNRLVRVEYADSSAVTFTYDENGNRIAMTDSIGSSSWQYDALNRMTSATDGFGQTIGYSYDAAGNRRTLVYPGNHTVTYSYDEVNRLVSVQDWLSHTTTYTYDPVGNLTDTVNANGTTANYGYDDANRLTHLADLDPAKAVIASYDIKLDAVGNHREVDQQEPLEVTPPEETVTYTYDKDHRLLKANDVVFTYDANGNTTARGADTFTFDARDRLVATQIAGVASTYRYDGLGNRLERTAGGVTTRYVVDLNGALSRILAEVNGGESVTAHYVHGLGVVSRVAATGSASCYHFDARGSTVAVSDISGTITDKYCYDIFGATLRADGATENPFRYIGAHGVTDDLNGLLQNRARYYAPHLGRFLSKDQLPATLESSQSINRFVYAMNNPARLIDVSGFCPVSVGNSSSDTAHDFILDLGERFTNKLTDKLLGDAVEAYVYDKLIDKLGDSGGGFLTFKSNVSLFKELLTQGLKEANSHGNVVDAFRNAGANISFGLRNPDAAIAAFKDGFDSTTAVSVNAITRELSGGYVDFDITGGDVSKLTNALSFGDGLYNQFHGTAIGNAFGF